MDEDPKFRAGYAKAKEEHIKWVNEAYRSGYGQAKADLLALIGEAMESCNSAIRDSSEWTNVPAERIKEIRMRQLELVRIRSLIKAAMKPGF